MNTFTFTRSFNTRVEPTQNVIDCASMFGIGVDEDIEISLYKDLEVKIGPGRIIYITGDSGAGKAQPVTSPVLTPTGWRRLGDLVIGDSVIDPTGGIASVVSVNHQGMKRTFRVEMSDGTSTLACADHLWSVKTTNHRVRGESGVIRTTAELSRDLTWRSGEYKWYIPITAAMNFSEHWMRTVDPYTIGALLGDGSLTGNTPVLTTVDDGILECVESALPETYSAVPTGKCSYALTHGRKGAPNWLREQLEALGMWGKRSWEKTIPDTYLWCNIEDRIALLQGLFDTDGCAARTGVEYVTTSQRMADQVTFLVRSLGGLASQSREKKHFVYKGQRKQGRYSWRLFIRLPAWVRPFRLERKNAAYHPERARINRKIVDISEQSVEECVCIVLDSKSQLYLTDDMIVTHNSCLLRDIASRSDEHADTHLIEDMDVSKMPEKPLVDQFGDWPIKEIGQLLAFVGIAEAFVYLRKPRELSDGQRYRFKLAKMIFDAKELDSEATAVICIDEFLAFLDRETAKNVAYQTRRVSTIFGLCFVVATTHEDIARDLRPNQSITMRLNLPPELKTIALAGI